MKSIVGARFVIAGMGGLAMAGLRSEMRRLCTADKTSHGATHLP